MRDFLKLLDNYYHPTTSPLEKKFEKIRIVLREKKKENENHFEKASRKNPTTAFERKKK